MVNTLLYVSYLLICISSNYLSLLYTKKLVRTTKKMNFLTIFLAKMLTLRQENNWKHVMKNMRNLRGISVLSWRQVLTYFNILHIIMKNIEKTQKRSIKGPVSDKRTVGWCETADGKQWTHLGAATPKLYGIGIIRIVIYMASRRSREPAVTSDRI